MDSSKLIITVLLINFGIGIILMWVSDKFILKYPTYRRMKEMYVILLLYRDVDTVILIPAFFTFFTEMNDISQQLWMIALMFCGLLLDWWVIRTLENNYSTEDIEKFIRGRK